jgi:hypothetical protein
MLPIEYGGGDSAGVGGVTELASPAFPFGEALDGNSGARSSTLWIAISKNFLSPLHAFASAIISSDLSKLGATHTARFLGLILLTPEFCATSAIKGSRCLRNRTRLLFGNASSKRSLIFRNTFSSSKSESSIESKSG